MVKLINGQTWFCCPRCGKKIHPVRPGACGVYVVCKQKREDGTRCNWSGEIKFPEKKVVIEFYASNGDAAAVQKKLDDLQTKYDADIAERDNKLAARDYDEAITLDTTAFTIEAGTAMAKDGKKAAAPAGTGGKSAVSA